MTHDSIPQESFLRELDALADSIEIFDIHNHAGSWKGSLAGGSGGLTMQEEIERRDQALARFSTDAACLMPSPRADGGLAAIRRRNDEVSEQIAMSSKLPVGLFSVPLDDPNEAIAEIERCAAAG